MLVPRVASLFVIERAAMWVRHVRAGIADRASSPRASFRLRDTRPVPASTSPVRPTVPSLRKCGRGRLMGLPYLLPSSHRMALPLEDPLYVRSMQMPYVHLPEVGRIGSLSNDTMIHSIPSNAFSPPHLVFCCLIIL
jgi:hypothetical protein